ncbi:MAG: hypothetical protein ACOYD6_06335 [Limnochordia bacterium]|jgi:hypothetical protein
MNNYQIEFAGMGFVVLMSTLFTILLALVIWQWFKSSQLRITSQAELARDKAYRKLAEEAVSLHQQIAEYQEKLVADLSEMKGRIKSIEQILREVE